MRHRKEEARPALESKRATANQREQSIAQKRTDRFGFWCGLMWAAMVAYIAFSEAGVIA